MTVEEIRQWANYQLNKHQTGNTLNKEEYNLCLAWANMEYFKTKYGLPEQYVPGRPIPAQAFQITQKVMDDMRPFLKSRGGKNFPMLQIDANGWAQIPQDYVHVSSIRYGKAAVEIISNDVLGDRLASSVVEPTKRYPVCVIYSDYLQFYPIDLAEVKFDYLRTPVTPVWAATLVNDEWVYDAARSVQLEWPQDTHQDIANLIVQYASNNLRDMGMYQVAERRKDEGQ